MKKIAALVERFDRNSEAYFSGDYIDIVKGWLEKLSRSLSGDV
ncbi:MAG: hypothetical protein ACRENG_35300 [bacterium]